MMRRCLFPLLPSASDAHVEGAESVHVLDAVEVAMIEPRDDESDDALQLGEAAVWEAVGSEAFPQGESRADEEVAASQVLAGMAARGSGGTKAGVAGGFTPHASVSVDCVSSAENAAVARPQRLSSESAAFGFAASEHGGDDWRNAAAAARAQASGWDEKERGLPWKKRKHH